MKERYVKLSDALRVLRIYSRDEFEQKIESIPAADVRENVHGHWVKLDMHRGMEQYKCSACGQSCYVPECMGEPMYLFCPDCGARMDGGNKR